MISRATAAEMTNESKSVKTQIYHLIHAHGTLLQTPPICHGAVVSMVSREEKHTRLSGLHMHEFQGKQGFKFAKSVSKRLHFLNSVAPTAGVAVEVD